MTKTKAAKLAGSLQQTASALDSHTESCTRVPPSHLHALYLVSSHLYYRMDLSMMQDHTFDRICRWMLDHYTEDFQSLRSLDNHQLDRDSLSAGTGFNIEFGPETTQVSAKIAERLL